MYLNIIIRYRVSRATNRATAHGSRRKFDSRVPAQFVRVKHPFSDVHYTVPVIIDARIHDVIIIYCSKTMITITNRFTRSTFEHEYNIIPYLQYYTVCTHRRCHIGKTWPSKRIPTKYVIML